MLYLIRIKMLNFPFLLNLSIEQAYSFAHCNRNAAFLFIYFLRRGKKHTHQELGQTEASILQAFIYL